MDVDITAATVEMVAVVALLEQNDHQLNNNDFNFDSDEAAKKRFKLTNLWTKDRVNSRIKLQIP
jgi:hypothetical protein